MSPILQKCTSRPTRAAPLYLAGLMTVICRLGRIDRLRFLTSGPLGAQEKVILASLTWLDIGRGSLCWGLGSLTGRLSSLKK